MKGRLVIAGVSGCGKTTVGRALAERLQVPFLDADDFHPPENIAKMRSGVPLDDDDRAPWLEALGAALSGQGSAVLACSALKRAYRDRLRELAGPIRFIVLSVPREELERRLRGRDHFMPPALLDSQSAALELDEDTVTVDGSDEPSSVVETLVRALIRS